MFKPLFFTSKKLFTIRATDEKQFSPSNIKVVTILFFLLNRSVSLGIV